MPIELPTLDSDIQLARLQLTTVNTDTINPAICSDQMSLDGSLKRALPVPDR